MASPIISWTPYTSQSYALCYSRHDSFWRELTGVIEQIASKIYSFQAML
jgi:hypothetical protein